MKMKVSTVQQINPQREGKNIYIFVKNFQSPQNVSEVQLIEKTKHLAFLVKK